MKKVLLPFLLVSQIASADLVLDNSVSQLNFGSIKNNNVAELHSFTTLSGTVDKSGKAVIQVALGSVDTRIDVRDQRMKEHLFQVEQFPKAIYSTSIDLDGVEKMNLGDIQQRRLKGELDLHGMKVDMEILVRIVKSTGDSFTVYAVEPAFIRVDDFGLGAGVDKLKELAGLESITRAVPLSFSVVFRKAAAGDKPGDEPGEKPEEESPLRKILPF